MVYKYSEGLILKEIGLFRTIINNLYKRNICSRPMLPVDSLEMYTSPKIKTMGELAPLVEKLKQQGKTVGLCHGGFDLLHSGHLTHFTSAKKLCDFLVVSITSDRFVSSRKGDGRPIFTEKLRAYAIACLGMVDYVVITDVEKAIPVLEALKPSFYIKGPDFVGKTTPGITAEREAITRVGGEMRYTNDPKLGTTEIIDYIKNKLDRKELLLILDRDGTLIEHEEFFGRSKNWKAELKLNLPVVNYLSDLQTKYKTLKIVVSNQAGVARGYFTSQTVEEIHHEIDRLLKEKKITVESWHYSPDVDMVYAEAKKKELHFDSRYIKEKTERKPNPDLVWKALRELKREIGEFSDVVVLGDREEDAGLAKNLNCRYIDVNGKKYEELVKEFS